MGHWYTWGIHGWGGGGGAGGIHAVYMLSGVKFSAREARRKFLGVFVQKTLKNNNYKEPQIYDLY